MHILDEIVKNGINCLVKIIIIVSVRVIACRLHILKRSKYIFFHLEKKMRLK